MEPAVATKLVDLTFQSIAGNLQKMLKEEAALLAGVEDDVRDIVAELRSIASFLTAMSTRRNLDDQLQNWVQEVREVAYDAEDSIDEFVLHLRSKPYDERGVRGFFKHFLHYIKSLKARHDIGSDLKKVKVQVANIRTRHDRYSHSNEAFTSSSSDAATRSDMVFSDPRIISHFVEEAQLVGINESRDKIMGWVMDENRLELIVIALVGFGGLGKTTLAKTVYDDPVIVGGHFPCRAWITVSQNYNIRQLLKQIIRKISVNEQQIRDVIGCRDASLNTEQLLNMMEESQLVQTVRGHLHGKRYLLVFDDVWRTEAWESLRIALPPDEEGSRVIVTTRIEEVANTSCSRNHQFIFKVSPLSSQLSWELFRRRVFEAPDYSCPPELENIGKDILQKCNGLPLAIVMIGGLLASRPDKKLEEWKDLHDHLRLEIQTNDMLSKINQILVLSYNDLPYHLKPCFLFLGIFPEDYMIRRKCLMRQWIAEGIVNSIDEFSAEKVAERCFNQLVSRNLVQPSKFDDNGTVKSCRVHDMMLDVILSISKKENFMVLLKEHPVIPQQHQKKRRLSWQKESSGLVPNTDLSHLRSFNAFGEVVPLKFFTKKRRLRVVDLEEEVPLEFFTKKRRLRVVDLEGCRHFVRFHPKSFSKLFLLKYLSLRNIRLLVELPESIGDLQNLEFLDIRGTRIKELPSTIVKLQKLVYLLAGPWGVRLPKGIRKLKKLVALVMANTDNVQLLQEIGELVDLQKLGIRFDGSFLSLGMLEEITALLSKLNGSLRSLKIRQSVLSGNLKKAIDEVALPPLLLRKLLIDCKLCELPPWFASLNLVVKITLFWTLLQPEEIKVLGNLPALVNLKVGPGSFTTVDLGFDRLGFPRLKLLKIDKHNVSFKEGALRSLEIVKIRSPPESVDGIEHLHGLREVHIDTCNEDLKEKVKNIAANHPNRPKCFVTSFWPD
ncbi:disease resistance protein Pik-2-like [Curcuma longa]|uniref:disease resistance protein Pik-2-like n=1 Tax=Curcuma longa TaxID=136217 RepID=UPI003D9E36E3